MTGCRHSTIVSWRVACLCFALLVCASVQAARAAKQDLNAVCGQNRCDQCLSHPECGWCTSTWTCMHGNATGPQPVASATQPLPCAGSKAWVYTGGDTSACVPGVTQVQDPENTPAVPLQLDIICQNGGQRHYEEKNGNWTGNMYCDCPAGWSGVDCSACMSDAVCGSADGDATGTCTQALSPASDSPAQALDSQRFSCECIGVAAELCGFLSGNQGLQFVVDLQWSDKSGSTKVLAGVPRATPDILFSSVLADVNMSDCAVTSDTTCPTGDVYHWSGDAPCMQVKCKTPPAHFVYPPHKVPTCVNGGHGQACYYQGGSTCQECVDYTCWDRSWRYNSCSALGTLSLAPVTFTCQHGSGSPYQCAWGTDGFGPLSLQCATGACV